MKQQTAVKWLIERYKELIVDAEINDTHFHILNKKRNDIFEQAKAMELKQLENAYNECRDGDSFYTDSFDEYYNQTYK